MGSTKSCGAAAARRGKYKKRRSRRKAQREEEEEEKIEPAPYSRILKYGASEWPYMVTGAIFAAILGAFPLLFAIILSKLLDVSRLNSRNFSESFIRFLFAFSNF